MGSITYVLLIGLNEDMLETVFEHLKLSLAMIGWLFLLPLIITEAKADFTRRVLEEGYRYINRFEPTGEYFMNDFKNINGQALEPAVLGENLRTLTSTSGLLAWCKWSADVYEYILEYIEAAAESDVQTMDSLPEGRVIRKKITSLKQLIRGNKLRASYLQQRREGYIQTVSRTYKSIAMASGPAITNTTQMYSLIAQRDNAENIRLADASFEIAKAGLQGNMDMKTVALATLQDSAAMRTIAAVTTFFLPATFTAVSFSPNLPASSAKALADSDNLRADALQHYIF